MDKRTKEYKDSVKHAKEIQRKGKIYEFVVSESWQIIRKRVIDKIIHLDSIQSLSDQECTRQDILANRKAVKLLFDWLNETEGEAREYNVLMNEVQEDKKKQIILNMEEEE